MAGRDPDDPYSLYEAERAAIVSPTPTFVVFGPPAGGKTQVAARLAKTYGLAHIEPGSLIKEALAKGKDIARKKALFERKAKREARKATRSKRRRRKVKKTRLDMDPDTAAAEGAAGVARAAEAEADGQAGVGTQEVQEEQPAHAPAAAAAAAAAAAGAAAPSDGQTPDSTSPAAGSGSEAATAAADAKVSLYQDLDERIMNTLVDGGAVPEADVLLLLRRALESPSVAFRGYVLDGVPSSAAHLAALESWGVRPEYVIRIMTPEEDVQPRVEGIRVDPMTGHTFPALVLNPPKPPPPPPGSSSRDTRIIDKLAKANPTLGRPLGHPDADDAAYSDIMSGSMDRDYESGSDTARDLESLASGENMAYLADLGFDVDNGYDEYDDDDSMDSFAIREAEEAGRLTRRVRERLIIPPSVLAQDTSNMFASYHTKTAPLVAAYVDPYAAKNPDKVINLDGSLVPAAVFRHLVSILDRVPVTPVVEPLKLAIPDGFENYAPADQLDHLATVDLDEDAPARSLSRWGTYCPVALRDAHAMIDSVMTFPVAYRSKIYFTSSRRARRRFILNPVRYLDAPPEVFGLRIAVLGPPLAGKSTQAARIAAHYGLQLINVHKLVDAALADADASPLGKECRDALANGGTIPPALYASLVASSLGLLTADNQAIATSANADATAGSGDASGPSSDAAAPVDGPDDYDDYDYDYEEDDYGYDDPPVDNDDFDHDYDDDYDDYDDDDGYAYDDDWSAEPLLSAAGLDPAAPGSSDATPGRVATAGSAGWVMDGFPNTVPQLEALAILGIVPTNVIVLEAEADGGADSDSARGGRGESSLFERAARLGTHVHTGSLVPLDGAGGLAGPSLSSLAADGLPTPLADDGLFSFSTAPAPVPAASLATTTAAAAPATAPDSSSPSETGPSSASATVVAPPSRGRVPEILQLASLESQLESYHDQLPLVLDAMAEIDVVVAEAKEALRESSKQGGSHSGDDGDDDGDGSESVTSEQLQRMEGMSPRTALLPPVVEYVSCVEGMDTVFGSVLQVIDPFVEVPRDVQFEDFVYYHEHGVRSESESVVSEESLGRGRGRGGRDDASNTSELNEHTEFVDYGDTGRFCPVRLAKHGELVQGYPTLCLSYQDKLYTFSEETALENFRANPSLYLPHVARPDIPPPRILLVGPDGVGKTTTAGELAALYGLPVLSLLTHVRDLLTDPDAKASPAGQALDAFVNPPKDDYSDADDYDYDDGDRSAQYSDGGGESGDYDDDREGYGVERGVSPASDILPLAGRGASPMPEFLMADTTGGAGKSAKAKAEQVWDDAKVAGLMAELDPTVLTLALISLVTSEPQRSTGWVLDGLPLTLDAVDALLGCNARPDVVFACSASDRMLLKRAFVPPPPPATPEPAPTADSAEGQGPGPDSATDAYSYDNGRDGPGGAGYDDEYDELSPEERHAMDVEDARNAFLARSEEQHVAMAELLDDLKAANVNVIELDMSRRLTSVMASFKRLLKPFLDQRGSLLEAPRLVLRSEADQLLRSGRRAMSKFGLYCPVALKDESSVLLPQRKHPVIYRGHVYYLSSSDAARAFLADPVKYTLQPPPPLMLPTTWARPRVAIIGPDKSGRSHLAKRLESELGVVRLSMGEILRRVLLSPHTALAKSIRATLLSGGTVSDEHCVAALASVVHQDPCDTRGWVLDGFPSSIRQMELMEEAGVTPGLVFSINLDKVTVLERAQAGRAAAERAFARYDSQQIISTRYDAFIGQVATLEAHYADKYLNLCAIDGTQSKWELWNTLKTTLIANVARRQAYLQAMKLDRAAPAGGLNFTDFDTGTGAWGDYCVVCLGDAGELRDLGVGAKASEFIASYKGAYYKQCSQSHLDAFISNPEAYLVNPLPDPLPEIMDAAASAILPTSAFELRGFCPVTYASGPKGLEYLKARAGDLGPDYKETIVEGDKAIAIRYGDKLFTFVDEDARTAFMRTPQRFVDLVLPAKLPPQGPRFDQLDRQAQTAFLGGLPMRGFMEQQLGPVLNDALLAVGEARPVFPTVSPTSSALTYLAMCLKSRNPASSEYVRGVAVTRQATFKDDAGLTLYLAKHNPMCCESPTADDASSDHAAKIQRYDALLQWMQGEAGPSAAAASSS